MPEQKDEKKTARGETVTVRVEPEKAMRFRVGTRWEVVASSVESFWEGQHTITLEEIET